MNVFKSGIVVILMIAFAMDVSQSEEGGWRKIKEDNGIVGYVRPTEKSPVDEIRAVGIVNAPIAAVEAVIRDVSLMPQYVFLCKESLFIDTADMKSGGDTIYFYNRIDLPFPASDRDAVLRARWSIDKKTGTVYCRAENVQTTFMQDKQVVRIPLSFFSCTLIPLGKDRTQLVYQALVHPGGELPSFIVNMLTRDYGIKTIAGLREMVKKESFRSVRKVVTTTPEASPPSFVK